MSFHSVEKALDYYTGNIWIYESTFINSLILYISLVLCYHSIHLFVKACPIFFHLYNFWTSLLWFCKTYLKLIIDFLKVSLDSLISVLMQSIGPCTAWNRLLPKLYSTIFWLWLMNIGFHRCRPISTWWTKHIWYLGLLCSWRSGPQLKIA